MSGERWQDAPEGPEPGEAHAPPETPRPVFGEVPGEAPTADLGNAAGRADDTPAPHEADEGAPPRQEAPVPSSAVVGEPAPREPEQSDAPVPAPEPVVSHQEELQMPTSEPTPPEPPRATPDGETVAGDGHGPAPHGLSGPAHGGESPWERPEVLLGAAFACGLLVAVLVRRRRS